MGKGQVKYATISERKTTNFIWHSIIYRFGSPHTIVTDNGKQFDNANFKEFCQNLNTQVVYASPAHPQTNGQVEAVNKIIKQLLKARLEGRKEAW